MVLCGSKCPGAARRAIGIPSPFCKGFTRTGPERGGLLRTYRQRGNLTAPLNTVHNTVECGKYMYQPALEISNHL